MKRRIYLLLAIAIGLSLIGCASGPIVSADDSRTQVFQGVDYDTVFRAVSATLVQAGYEVRGEDRQEGRIVGAIERPDAFAQSREFTLLVGGGDSGTAIWERRTGEGYEVSVAFSPVDASRVRVKMSLHRVEFYNQGGSRVSALVGDEEYQSLFEKVRSQIKRQLPKGRA
jgi:hypothetical protein